MLHACCRQGVVVHCINIDFKLATPGTGWLHLLCRAESIGQTTPLDRAARDVMQDSRFIAFRGQSNPSDPGRLHGRVFTVAWQLQE